MTPQCYGSKSRRQDSTEQRGRDRTAQAFVDERKEFRERGGVIAGKGPPGTRDGEDSADEAGN